MKTILRSELPMDKPWARKVGELMALSVQAQAVMDTLDTDRAVVMSTGQAGSQANNNAFIRRGLVVRTRKLNHAETAVWCERRA